MESKPAEAPNKSNNLAWTTCLRNTMLHQNAGVHLDILAIEEDTRFLCTPHLKLVHATDPLHMLLGLPP